MTASELQRLERVITDLRVDLAGQIATVLARLGALEDHETRIRALEASTAGSGRYSWGDAGRLVAAVAGVVGVAYTATHWG